MEKLKNQTNKEETILKKDNQNLKKYVHLFQIIIIKKEVIVLIKL